MSNVNPWVPTSDPRDLKVLGKASEELTECATAIARCIVQGIDEKEPTTGKPNRVWLTEEVADAYNMLAKLVDRFDLDTTAIQKRIQIKSDRFDAWLAMVPADEPRSRYVGGSVKDDTLDFACNGDRELIPGLERTRVRGEELFDERITVRPLYAPLAHGQAEKARKSRETLKADAAHSDMRPIRFGGHARLA
jgi:hypothetical protein